MRWSIHQSPAVRGRTDMGGDWGVSYDSPPELQRPQCSIAVCPQNLQEFQPSTLFDGWHGHALSEGSFDRLTLLKASQIIAEEIGYDIGAYANERR